MVPNSDDAIAARLDAARAAWNDARDARDLRMRLLDILRALDDE